MRSTTVSMIVAGLLLLAVPAAGQNRLPPKQRTLIFFKSLTYDNNISRGRDALRVGIVSRKGGESATIGREMETQIKGVANMKVGGLKITGDLLAGDAFEALRGLIEEKKVNILYLAPGLDKAMDGLCDLAQKKRILVVSGEVEYSKKCSTLTFILRDNKPKILVNLKAAGAQGAAFKPEFLKVAETVR